VNCGFYTNPRFSLGLLNLVPPLDGGRILLALPIFAAGFARYRNADRCYILLLLVLLIMVNMWSSSKIVGKASYEKKNQLPLRQLLSPSGRKIYFLPVYLPVIGLDEIICLCSKKPGLNFC
jgi:hypothetical protein